MDATLLAVAGLARMGYHDKITSVMSIEEMLPAAAQGVVGVQIRTNDKRVRDVVSSINSPKTFACALAERAMLGVLDGSCKTPIGALATINGDQMQLEGLVAEENGRNLVRMKQIGAANSPETIGCSLGEQLRSQFPAEFFAA